MLKKRRLTVLLTVIIFILCTVLSSCSLLPHSHTYDGAKWQSDDDYHWQNCTICGKGEVKSPHAIDWVVDTPATDTTEGSRHGVCSVCERTFTQTIPIVNHQHVVTGDWQSNADTHWQICSTCNEKVNESAHSKQWVVDTPATTTSTGSKHSECSVCKRTFETQIIDQLTSETRTVDLFAINDFHGATEKISQVGGFLKGKVNDNPNTLLLNSGDMFQGSMESNSNFGDLLSKCMAQIGFNAFTFGNHEFDWGLENLQKLASESSVPFLGANIYHWDATTKQWGTFADELAQKYVIKTLDNGLKVGIIGVIGQDQITSISSNLVQTIGFKDPLPIIKELAAELRNQQDCDVVVVSAHVGPQALVGETENNEQPSSAGGLKGYVDAVFCAHTHRYQSYTVDGIPFIQGGSYGEYVSHVKLTVNANGNVSVTAQENIKRQNSWDNLLVVTEMVNNSNEQIKEERNQTLATLDGDLDRNPAIARLVSRAIAEYAISQGHTDIVLGMVNTARNDLEAGTLTYSQLYEAIPFDNVVYVANVKGSEILNEVRYGNYFWRVSGEKIESNKYYKIAVIDYLLFHQNASRDYNYFRSAFDSSNSFAPTALTNNGELYNYRQITRDWLLANPTVKTTDYTLSNTNTDTSKIGENVTLKYQPTGSWSYGTNVASVIADVNNFDGMVAYVQFDDNRNVTQQ
ncbi:MAG: bifunctional metallophosphatase/5'-nucleotidase [Clostridia bacterium]|nr:bifunctional metallophosphatase/5'-nucleotidase [Clostridia bacterium]